MICFITAICEGLDEILEFWVALTKQLAFITTSTTNIVEWIIVPNEKNVMLSVKYLCYALGSIYWKINYRTHLLRNRFAQKKIKHQWNLVFAHLVVLSGSNALSFLLQHLQLQ